MKLNRTLQGYMLITASTLLFINNIDSLIGASASLLFILANALGLILHWRKNKVDDIPYIRLKPEVAKAYYKSKKKKIIL